MIGTFISVLKTKGNAQKPLPAIVKKHLSVSILFGLVKRAPAFHQFSPGATLILALRELSDSISLG